jgi:Uma2 family endonuclease
MTTLQDYLNTSYPDGDREYLDGLVVERNVGTPRIQATRDRVPDLVILKRPFEHSERVILDTPLLLVEILSPDDCMRDTIQRFRDYETLGVPHIVQMDPEDRTTVLFLHGDLVRRDLTAIDIPCRGALPFAAVARGSRPAHKSAPGTAEAPYGIRAAPP